MTEYSSNEQFLIQQETCHIIKKFCIIILHFTLLDCHCLLTGHTMGIYVNPLKQIWPSHVL